MATADPGSGPISLFGLSNKLQSKVNSFREVIERKKLEVKEVCKEMRSLIEKKEDAIIRELDAIWEEVNARMQKKKVETQKKIEEIEKKSKEIEIIFQELNLTHKLQISEFIDPVRGETDIDIPNVKLSWRVDELKNCINRMCRCDQQILVYNEDTRYQLKWSKCDRGRGNNQLYYPRGIATHPMNENIYAADLSNHRVQIFSREGEWIRSVEDDEMKYPQNILFHNQSIYVQCNEAIQKLNESTEEKEKSKSYGFCLGGICTDNIHIYVGQWKGMNLIVLTLDLIEENRISLKTEFTIQVFSKEGILTRCVVKKDSINNAYCLCLDQQHNILVADNGYSKVKIFSNDGKLLTQFGEKGSVKGKFSALVGISLSEFGDIVTVQQSNSHLLQVFSLL